MTNIPDDREHVDERLAAPGIKRLQTQIDWVRFYIQTMESDLRFKTTALWAVAILLCVAVGFLFSRL